MINDNGLGFGKFLLKQLCWSLKAFIIGVILILIMLLLANVVKAQSLNDGIVSYYNFSENTGTYTKNAVNNTLYGLSSVQSWGSGQVGYAVNFSANTPRLQNSSYSFGEIGTICLWLYVTDNSRRNDFIGISSGSVHGYLIYSNASDFLIYSGADARNIITLSKTGLINNSQWISECYSWNTTSDVAKMYINGVMKANITSPLASLGSAITLLTVGNAYAGTTTFLNGGVDEVAYWNRMLTDEEITEYHTKTNSGYSYPFPTESPEVDYTPLFVSQVPSDIDTFNIFGNPLLIVYNNTQPSITSSFINYSFVNAQIVINGTSYNGFQKNYTNNTGELYTYSLYDNEVYPAVYNINESIMENTPHGNFTISNSNNYYLVSLIGINTSKTNSFLEAMVSASGNGRVYYCNSSYTTGNIKNNNNCVLFGVFDTSDFNHSHGSHSKHNVFSMPIINGSVGSVKVTSNSSFVFTRESGTVYLGYVNVTSRDDSVKYSNNNGNSWTNLGDLYTVDLHLHQYDNNTEGLKYNVCTVNSTETVCSVSRTDYFNISYLPPTSVNVLLNKESFYYQDILTANRTDSSAFYGDISNYSWYIVDVDFNEIKYINTTNETSINHTLQNLSPGYYYVMVKVTDTNNLSSYSYSDYFYVGSEFLSPCNETLTVNSTGVDVFFNWTTDILSGETFISGVNGTNNLTFTNSTGYLTINNTMYSYYGLYELYMTQYITSDTGCYLDLCKNNWVTNIGKCIDGFQDVTYSDVNACPEEYDKPSDYTQTCTVDASTFNVFFLIIILGLVLLIIGLIWKNNIFIMFGGLLLFLAGVMMLIEPINNLTETMNLIVGVLLFGFGAWIWVTSTLNMIESGNEQDEEEW